MGCANEIEISLGCADVDVVDVDVSKSSKFPTSPGQCGVRSVTPLQLFFVIGQRSKENSKYFPHKEM